MRSVRQVHDSAEPAHATTPSASISKLPVAVTVKPVLAMIRAYMDKDGQTFKANAREVARELELNNEQELALYIYAQFGDVRTFEVTD